MFHSVSELASALRDLGARHPEAYENFVKQLRPSTDDVSDPQVDEGKLWRAVERSPSVGKREDVSHSHWNKIERRMSE